MSKRSGWLSLAINSLREGCERSPYISRLQSAEETLKTGQELCLLLWPFISTLPANVASVQKILPTHMEDADRFFEQLADRDGYYRMLYRKQCWMAGVSDHDLNATSASMPTIELCKLMSEYCSSGDYLLGIRAVITAELAATIYARYSYAHFEKYFLSEGSLSSSVSVEEGLEWLRLHAKPHPRHAKWMKRTIDVAEKEAYLLEVGNEQSLQASEVEFESPNTMPEPVERITGAVLSFLESGSKTTLIPRAQQVKT